MNLSLSKIIEFTNFINKFREIERVILIKNNNRKENDAEHSYQLTMLSWYINDVGELNYSLDKIIKYSLIHDLVEIYAGDVNTFSTNKSDHENKENKEMAALEKIKREFPEFPELTQTITTYNKKQDPESKFVYILDKLIPILNIYLDGGRTWIEQKVTLEMLIQNKAPKIKQDKDLNRIFEELLDILKEKEVELFYKTSK